MALSAFIRLSLVCALPALAAEPDSPAEKARATPKAEGSAVVEVTAPLPTEPLVTVLDPKVPRQPLPAHDGAEYLKTLPGFTVIRKGGTDGDPVLRGMAGSRLSLLLDGEQILGGCGARMDPPTAYIFPESYDRITVVKGPQTVLYGPGTSAGTVRFERTNARFQRAGVEGFASLMGGSFGRHDEVADVRAGTPLFYVRGIGTRSHADDYDDGQGVSVHSRYTRWSAQAALGWTPDDDTRLELTGARSDGEAAYADRSVDGSKFLRENLGFKGEFRRLSTLVERVEFQVYRNHVDHIMDTYSLRTFIPSMMAPEPAAMNPDRTTTGGRLALELRLRPGTLLTAGLDAQANEHTGRMSMMQWSMPEENLPRVADARFRNAGIFAEASHALSGRDRVLSGLRLDRWHAEDPRARVAITMMMSAVNPTAGQRRDETLTSGFLRYERDVATGSTLYAGLGRAERFPDYWEAITKESLASLSAFGTRPERTSQVDLGWVKQAGTVRASISTFYGRVSDFILIQSNVTKPTMSGSRLATVSRNIDATTWGGEVAVQAKVMGALRADGSLVYVRGENDTDGRALAQMPPLEARLDLTWDAHAWSAGLLARGVARQDRIAVNQGNIVGQDLGPSAGFGTLSLHAGWRPADGWLLTCGVDNLFDRAYAEHISRNASLVPGYAVQSLRVREPGRNAWLKASFRFGGPGSAVRSDG
ncbi:MAG: TonB-dependent copper receptor [Holophagaceae bacterium]|nr:TonB-dependent copper receptor [Holophagaceae bacterium]